MRKARRMRGLKRLLVTLLGTVAGAIALLYLYLLVTAY